jgi:hypothetical protein
MPAPGAKKGADADDVAFPYRCSMATCKRIVMTRIIVFWDLKGATGYSETSVHVYQAKSHATFIKNLQLESVIITLDTREGQMKTLKVR